MIKIKVEIDGKTTTIDTEAGKTLESVIRDLGYLPDEILVMLENRPVILEREVEEKMEINIIKVASGG